MAGLFYEKAIAALDDPKIVREPGFCQKFVRQVIQATYGHEFDTFHKATADKSLEAWKHSKYAIDADQGSLPGDILYYREREGRRHGHVAIRIPGNFVVENSIVHDNGDRGGKGTRPLKALGKPDLIVRLPPLEKKIPKK